MSEFFHRIRWTAGVVATFSFCLANANADRPVYKSQLKWMRQECQRLVTFAKGELDTPPSTIVVPGIKEGKKTKTKNK